jgi:hypothetical protein
MTLAHPWALALAALAAPVLVAYLHKLHRERRTVASVILARVLRDERPASRRSRSRLRHRVSLALVLAALAGVLVALAGPHATTGHARRRVIMFDRSASMGTQDRLVRASEAVRALVDRAGGDDELALVASGADPAVEVAPTRAHSDVTAAAEALARRGASGDNHDDALPFRLADGLCRDPEHDSIVLVSDGAGVTIPRTRCPIEGLAVGAHATNLGISGLSVRALDGLGTYAVHIAVASSFHSDQQVAVTLTADGEIVDVVTLAVPLNGDAERTVREAVPRGRTLVATLPGGDANPLDDRAEVALADTGPISVLLVTTRKHSMFEEALRLHPRVHLAVAPPDHLPAEPVDLIVLEDDVHGPLPRAPRVVSFGVAPGLEAPLQLSGDAEDRRVARWDYDAPWFRYVDLHDLILGRARLVSGGKAVVETGAGPIVATVTSRGREWMMTGFAIDATDLTLRAAFPNLVANLVEWAGPTTSSPARGVLATAESHVDPQPLPAFAAAPTTGWTDAPAIVRVAIALAVALLLAEQALYLRRRPA